MSGRSEFSKGWRVLGAALIGVTCGASPLPFNVLPLVMGPIHEEFGWDFAAISVGVTIYGILASIMAPVFGAMADRFGVRPVALLSTLAFGLSFAAFWFTPSSLLGYYLLWTVLGLVAIGSTPVTWSRAISMWFSRNRGTALAIMLMGTSLAGMVVPQFASAAITAGGWRLAFPALALMPLLVALPIAFFWFREPRKDEMPEGVADAQGAVLGLSLSRAARSYRFWLLFVSIMLISFAYGGAHLHMAQIVQLHGFGIVEAASVMSIVALGILSGRIIVGTLFDRFWAPGVAFPAMLLPALACYLLMGSSSTLAMLMTGGFLLGFAAGAEGDVIAFLAAKYFGMASYGRIYGILYMPFGICSALSPLAYGAVRDSTGSYDLMLSLAIPMFVLGGGLLLLLGRYPDLTRIGLPEESGTPVAAN